MEQEKDEKKIINRDYIGVVKEVNDRLKYVEIEIPHVGFQYERDSQWGGHEMKHLVL